MDYGYFCKILKGELPLNRKERFYTGTVLPALLFHNGLSNLYHFFSAINNFPREVNEGTTADIFLFYTEYNLRESAGDRNVGRRIVAYTKDTPDVIVEILKPIRIFIIIEAKMFEKINQSKLNGQVSRQRKYVSEPLKKTFQLEDNQIFHIALVPEASGIKDSKYYQVINWEFFIGNQALDVTSNYFYNYLKFALDNYKDLVAKNGPPGTVEDYKTGEEIYRNGKNNGSWWVGMRGVVNIIIEDAKTNKWKSASYGMNTIKPPAGRKGNWITSKEFAELVDRYRE